MTTAEPPAATADMNQTMSDQSERRLQRILNQHGYYTVRTPGSGTGLSDPDSDRRHKHADVVAIRDLSSGPGSDVLVLEDKHAGSYPVYITADQYDAVTTVAARSGAVPVFAVQIKHTHYPHDFHVPPVDQTDGGNYALRADGQQVTLDELVTVEDRQQNQPNTNHDR